MKALFLQTKICEVSQIRINLNSLGLVVNKHCQRLKHTTKLGDANKLAFYFKIQFQYSRCGFQQFHWKQSTSVTRHIIDGNVVAVPNQVVGGRVSLLNKGNFCHFGAWLLVFVPIHCVTKGAPHSRGLLCNLSRGCFFI